MSGYPEVSELLLAHIEDEDEEVDEEVDTEGEEDEEIIIYEGQQMVCA